jgi:hypothetical protein
MRRIVLACLLPTLAFFSLSRCTPHTATKDENVLPCLAVQMVQVGSDLRISNLDAFDYHEVKITLNSTETFDGFKLSIPIITAKATVQLPLRDFITEDGLFFNSQERVYVEGSLTCKEGIYDKVVCELLNKRAGSKAP